ncbi:MAG: DUF285 domain-containing protein [Clostridia bacterium]|nr:DUF285 domain-containing protein [Clostridia bacterium]
MLHINEFLVNKKINKKIDQYQYHPNTKEELIDNINEIIHKDNSNIYSNHIYNLNCIDTSAITDMSYLFCLNKISNYAEYFDISEWNVHNVNNMLKMFAYSDKFNCNISNWDVSNVQDMNCMFEGCKKFNQDISGWDVGNVTNMQGMFYECYNFNQDLNNWNVSKVKDMRHMFSECRRLKNTPTWYKE